MPEKKKPKYQIIEDYLLERINNNELRPGDQIETEMDEPKIQHWKVDCQQSFKLPCQRRIY